MFNNPMSENNKVDIVDVSGDVFEELLTYIYIGELNILDDLVGELVIAADKYRIEDLKIANKS